MKNQTDSEVETKKKCKFGAVWLWSVGQVYEECKNCPENLDALFLNDDKKIGCIYEFDKTKERLLSAIKEAEKAADYIYVVIDDTAKRAETVKIIPKHCGIFCDSNPFGLGSMVQIFQTPQPIQK